MVGEMLNGKYFEVHDLKECEILCLEHTECLRFSFSSQVCSLYKTYVDSFRQHGVVTGICVQTDVPTVTFKKNLYGITPGAQKKELHAFLS